MNKNIIIKAVGIFGVHTKKGYALAVALREFFGKRAKIVGFLPKRYEYYMCKDKGNVESNFHKEFNSRKNNFKIFNCFHYADWPYINIKYNDAERVL
ncbi:MAG: hypothetical protein IMZ53_00590, partial [Thermoplasmata archaeon]|nr:hypothetical protein [Thermoplasmata archaeon]